MGVIKVAITLDQAILSRLDRLVRKRVFPSRSKAIQAAIEDKLARMERSRLAAECARLDPRVEQAMAEEGMGLELEEWPQY
jgi:metal-responsive CopG/Arc/MetJ family transcriptional regulator